MLYGKFQESQNQQIKITDIKPSIFRVILRFMYTGSFQVEPETCIPLIQAADQFQLTVMKEELLSASKSLIENEQNVMIQIKNVLQLLCDAVNWGVA